MKLYDISMDLSSATPVWPGDPPLSLTEAARIRHGDPVNVTRADMSAHTGTHIDAPLHFIDGASGIDAYPLDTFIGPCFVIDVSKRIDIELVTAEILEEAAIPRGTERLLLKTPNSTRLALEGNRFFTDYCALSLDGAQWITARGIRLVGIDYLSIGPFTAPAPVHLELLGKNCAILEGLDLSAISEGVWNLLCLPLKLTGRDGAPARAVLTD